MNTRELQTKIFDRVNPAVKFSVTRYVLAVGIFVGVFAFGLVSMMTLGVDLFPKINIPVVVVVTSYPGATSKVVDEKVTQVIENAVSTLSGITDLSSSSSTGVSRVVISFDANTDKNADANQVAALVGRLSQQLPTNVQTPTVRTFDPNSQPIVQFGISSEKGNLEAVGTYVNNELIPILERVDGVANVSLDGSPNRQFQVLLKPDKLNSYKVTPQSVVTAITSSALNQPIGTIISQNRSIAYTTENLPSNSQEIENYLVDPQRGVYVKNLAAVRDVPIASNYARVNGKPVVLLSVQQTTDSNAVAVVKNVKELLSKTKLPAGYAITFSNDTTVPIRASIDATYGELFITALVVALICLLFLGKVNTAFSVILAIPIALSAAPVLYNLAGFSFNLVSLLALIVAIGIVVDDSIVVAENVERYRAMGYGLKESVLKGASEIFSAVVAATLSILSVLLPVSFIGGIIGRYIQQFSLGLSAAVFFSLLEAVLFLTVRLAYTPNTKDYTWKDFFESLGEVGRSLRWGLENWKSALWIVVGIGILVTLFFLKMFLYMPLILLYPLALAVLRYFAKIVLALFQSIVTPLHRWTEAGVEWVRDRYANGLSKILKGSVFVLIGTAIFFAGTVFFVWPKIPFNFVPQMDGGIMVVTLRLPPGTPATVTNEMTARLERYLEKQPEVLTIQAVVGNEGTGSTAIATNSNITCQLVPIEKRRNVFDLITTYRDAMRGLLKDQPSARLSVSSSGGFQGGGSALQLNVVSYDFNKLKGANSQIIQYLQNDPMVVDVNSSLSDVTFENRFVPDSSKMNGTGLNPNTVANNLQYATQGIQAAIVDVDGVSYPIQVSVSPEYLGGTQSLLNLPIYSPTLQTTLQVGQLGSFVLTEAPVSLNRYNRLYSAQLTVNLKPEVTSQLTFQNKVTAEMYQNGILGDAVNLQTSSRNGPTALAGQLQSLGLVAFGLGMFLVYLVMGAQFNSWRYPIYLLLPVPLALVGALWFVLLKGSGLDIFGYLGMLMLIGLSAKNAILYLDFVVERLDHMPFKDALIESARLRFRPIIMTTLTVLVISFPLIFGTGQGSEFGQKLGIVMLGGIVTSAILTFFVVPAAFYLFEKRRHPDSKIVPFGESVKDEKSEGDDQQPPENWEPYKA